MLLFLWTSWHFSHTSKRTWVVLWKVTVEELRQPVPIRTPLLVAVTLVPIGLTVMALLDFDPTLEGFVFLAVYLAFGVILVRAVVNRWRRKKQVTNETPSEGT